jgi:hypothetical protein
MKITAILLFEANAKDLAVEFATCDRLTDDRTEARDEQNLDISDLFHDISCSHKRSNQIDLTSWSPKESMQAVGCGNVGSYHTTPLPSPHGACTMTMNTTIIAATACPILSLDLGKYKSVACIYRTPDEKEFTTIPTSRAELTRLLAKHRPTVVLIEACILCGWVRDLCAELGVTCLVANTTSEAWKFKHLSHRPHTGYAGGGLILRHAADRRPGR